MEQSRKSIKALCPACGREGNFRVRMGHDCDRRASLSGVVPFALKQRAFISEKLRPYGMCVGPEYDNVAGQIHYGGTTWWVPAVWFDGLMSESKAPPWFIYEPLRLEKIVDWMMRVADEYTVRDVMDT